MKTSAIIFITACLLMASAGPAPAATTYIPPFGGRQALDNQGVAYMSGGVGINERHQMEERASGYNLKLVFDVRSGDYVSDVAVKVQNKVGQVLLDTTSDGPWFFASLPSGEYKVTADFNGRTIVQTVNIGDPVRQVIFTWRS